jgi:UDP-hydrolysing UDP-N-acetyl-D-glucosamine 2-epimerase
VRTIAVVTVGRSDYGIYLPVLRKIGQRPGLKLHLVVAGMHLSPAFGHTVDAIETDGFEIGDRVEISPPSDSPEAVAKSMGLGTIGYAQVLAKVRPDILLLLGDRFEMHAAAVAAVPLKIPIAHIHGGELTYGAIDDSFRHSITKLSHLHFVSTAEYGRRVAQMGEEACRIVVSGAPSLDNLHDTKLLGAADFHRQFGVSGGQDFLLITYHPATLEAAPVEQSFQAVLYALEASESVVLFTLANADSGGQTINRMIRDYVEKHPKARLIKNLGTQGYFSAMSLASAMVGNSSSGIIEAASFHLPVVNIGTRQQGRMAGPNVLNSDNSHVGILRAIKKAQSPEFRRKIASASNLYGDGKASDRIVDKLESVQIDNNLLIKKFSDL